ncbi:MAG: hypothetical protein HYV09_06960 [Deltaproteobacteria bacterium]|nr:hypothetical protein [Deltaproteobacteria bacterium]
MLLTACGARTHVGADEQPLTTSCGGDAPTCILASAAPCGAPEAVAATCDDATSSWSCPSGARAYVRVEPTTTCLPFRDGPLRALGGSLVRVATRDRCLWIAETVETTAGASLRNVAFATDPAAPLGACPTRAIFATGSPEAPESIVAFEEGEGPSLQVQITGGRRFGGTTRVTYRLFREDPGAPFGVTELGTGIGRFDEVSRKIVVSRRPRFGVDLELGDASLVFGEHLYLWGCPPPIDFLTERCVVARLDASNALELFAGEGKWVASARGRDGAPVFTAGPWISAVTRAGGAFTHVYTVGFGSDLQTHAASAPEGPWRDGPNLGRCELPAEDEHAFCAGPVVHDDLADPTRNELVVSYGVGTTAKEGARARPEAYWTRLARLRR